ncbi:hypothetical protein ACJRO7_006812 [Eucalyptus globulus]|uniref:F-box domain-containing protein n=1 Tax=Eucalyptus globulus TaxID=34317 RepID=A0ABD3IMZ1_EUCGL
MADGEGETEAGAVLHGDVLDLTLSYVPLVDLVSASRVSCSWRDAVFFSPRHLGWRRPWLLVYYQTIMPPHTISVRAYDPRSRVWMDLEAGPGGRSAILTAMPLLLRSSHSALLYGKYGRLSFSSDPLHLRWHHASCPSVNRSYPVVALVGSRLVVAGGTYFDHDSPPVEVYDMRTRTWSACYSMPVSLRISCASLWHSVATDGRRMYVMETLTGRMHTFDPDTGAWLQPYDLRPDRHVFYSLMGFAGDRLVVVGVLGNVHDLKGVKVWGSMGVGVGADELEEMCAMPEELLIELQDEMYYVSNMSMSSSKNFLYLHSDSSPLLVFWCGREDKSGAWRWGTTRDAAARDRNLRNWVAYTCAEVGIGELQKAAATGNGRFVVTTAEGR